MMITAGTAMAIAAQWQSPGRDGIDFAAFASTGTITGDLANVIANQIADIEKCDTSANDDEGATQRKTSREELRALLDYVRQCTVTPWVVGSNVAGYMPESDVAPFLSYAEAVTYYRDELTEAPDRIWPDDFECTCTEGGESCDYHLEQAAIAAHFADHVPSVIGDKVFGPERDLLYYVTPDFLPLPIAYWLQRGEPMTYAEYLAARDQ